MTGPLKYFVSASEIIPPWSQKKKTFIIKLSDLFGLDTVMMT